MIIIENASGNIFEAWKVTMGDLPPFLQTILDRNDLIVSGPLDYKRIKPIPFLDESLNTKIGIRHLNPQGYLSWDFASAGDIIVNKTHQYTDRADVEVLSPNKFNQRFKIYKH